MKSGLVLLFAKQVNALYNQKGGYSDGENFHSRTENQENAEGRHAHF
jgi:hypothetical protein